MGKVLSKREIKKVMEKLNEKFPDARAELNHSNPFELLIATILSAQCTDVRVNKTTDVLFKKVETPEDYINLGQEKLGEIIRSCGFYNTKSSNIIKTCQILIDEYNSQVPGTMDDLIKLPGVGRKTANVVLSNAFNTPAMAVDTHVFRVSNRIGLVKADNVLDTEMQLMENIEKNMWSKGHHLLIFQGRRVCKARNPLCEECNVREYCNYYKEKIR